MISSWKRLRNLVRVAVALWSSANTPRKKRKKRETKRAMALAVAPNQISPKIKRMEMEAVVASLVKSPIRMDRAPLVKMVIVVTKTASLLVTDSRIPMANLVRMEMVPTNSLPTLNLMAIPMAKAAITMAASIARNIPEVKVELAGNPAKAVISLVAAKAVPLRWLWSR